MRRALAALLLAGCGAAHAAPERTGLAAVELRIADRIDDRAFVVLRRVETREGAYEDGSELDWEAYLEVTPLAADHPASLLLLGPEGRCDARVLGAVRVELMSAPYAGEDDEESLFVDHVTFEALEVEAPCEGWLAVLGDDDTAAIAPAHFEQEYEHGGPDAFGTLGDRWRFVEERGPPPDEICPALPVYAIEREGVAVARFDRGDATLRGRVSVGDDHALIFDGLQRRSIVALDGRTLIESDLPDRVPLDIGASPCL